MEGSVENTMAYFVATLQKARDVAHMWHWKVKSFAQHMALGELYETLQDLTDELVEMYMGKYGTEFHIPLSEPNPFSEQSPLEFVQQLDSYLGSIKSAIPQDGWLINKFEELQGEVHRVKYKLENLH